MNDDLSQLSMQELFRVETETQAGVLTRGLLEVERGAATPEQLEALMRAAHSLKGAARIVNVPAAAQIAHAMEDCFVAAQQGQIELKPAQTDVLLRGVDMLVKLSQSNPAQSVSPSPPSWPPPSPKLAPAAEGCGGGRGSQVPKNRTEGNSDEDSGAYSTGQAPEVEQGLGEEIQSFLNTLATIPRVHQSKADSPKPTVQSRQSKADSPKPTVQSRQSKDPGLRIVDSGLKSDSQVRLTAENLNRLLGLAGESLVESRWPNTFLKKCWVLKRLQSDLERTLDAMRPALAESTGGTIHLGEQGVGWLNELFRQTSETRQFLADRLQELDLYDRRTAHLSNRLYLEVLRARMRPFGDSESVRSFPRMVRDLARSLGKQVKLEILGENTQVDRDILERLEAPLNHLLRNAVDHGCETPAERERAGKPPEATIRLEARHSAGMLMVVVSDDGAGVDPGRVRHLIADKKLTTPAVAEKMNESELLQFLFLPGFTLRETVTEISGRGVGLDIVQNMAKSVRGNLRVSSLPGRGMRFQLQLPLTMSVLRTLLVEVGGEPYAIPLAQIVSTLKLSRERIQALEGRHHFNLGEEQIGLLAAHQVLDCQDVQPPERELPVVVLGDRNTRYGLLVDRFLGERELVVQPLDARLGKVKDISAAALMEDGAPVLIVDVDDMVRSIEKLIASGTLTNVGHSALEPHAPKRKRVLAVDDSLTVRELERKLLVNRGYMADVAVDGMDGWNAVRTGAYDLVITDVDMPRMDGIELATLIKRDPQLKSLPVMIVSYKDREEDRLRGLEAGADYYLAKGSFHDETLLEAVVDLIGEPDS